MRSIQDPEMPMAKEGPHLDRHKLELQGGRGCPAAGVPTAPAPRHQGRKKNFPQVVLAPVRQVRPQQLQEDSLGAARPGRRQQLTLTSEFMTKLGD